ncbi:kinase-like protein [Schizopora paradoxa]|uniref:Kinase-like protein n=1 Tax=Schizopora paradoxa TaxID=27342 RepID=A0A0H2R512_9AGAM|nr:kinase-like protein [Schizopora paradoxa]
MDDISSQDKLSGIGGSSDTYTSTFKEKVLQDALVSSSCFVCRGSKESRSSEMTCKRCKYIWGGKLGIKQFRKRIKDRDQWKTVARDLHSLSGLSHPNLLPFVGYLLVEGFPALVTPWIEGGNLRDRIKHGNLSGSEEARGIADGLSYLHSKSIVHCDLKSANVFLSMTDSPLSADFGLSRFVEKDETILYTHADDSLGGPRWSAPELFESSQFTVETDVWAFGMLLYVST